MQSQQQLQFVNLLQEHRRLVYSIIHSYCEDENYKDDLFQDIVLRAWKSFPYFKWESKFSTWIGRIARNVAVDRLRTLGARIKTISHNNILFEIVDTPYEEVNLPVIENLSPIEKRTLEMRMNGLSYAEISQISGEPINRITVRMHRIKNLLSKTLYVTS